MSDAPASSSAPGPAGRRPGRSRWLPWLLALVVAWVAYLALFGPRRTPGELPLPDLGGAADLGRVDGAWEFRDLAGAPVRLSAFRGRPVVLNFWATWCPPCVQELPALAALAAEPGLDAAVVCVSVDDDPATVRDFLERRGLDLPAYWSPGAPPAPLDAEFIPATYVIGPDGRILARHVGPAAWDAPKVVAFLEGAGEAG